MTRNDVIARRQAWFNEYEYDLDDDGLFADELAMAMVDDDDDYSNHVLARWNWNLWRD